MSDYIANYWKTDQISPEVLSEMFTINLNRIISLAIHCSNYAKYNEETNSIELGYDCEKFGIDIPKDEQSNDIVNDEWLTLFNTSESFIYSQLLHSIEKKLHSQTDGSAKGLASEMIFRICQYIGASSGDRYRWNDSDIWEKIHYE
tara:strand:+ start:547 stop:984 length:438 start_codon:yes stop_codon:yes gene_type:complete